MESKPWYLSKTIWGLAVAAAAMLLQGRRYRRGGERGLDGRPGRRRAPGRLRPNQGQHDPDDGEAVDR